MQNNIAKSFEMLGYRATDRITGTVGVVTTVTFDLYGCIQVLLHPGLDKDGKVREQNWVDINRLEPIAAGTERVMPLPDHIAKFISAEDVLTRAGQPGALRVDHRQGAADKPPMTQW